MNTDCRNERKSIHGRQRSSGIVVLGVGVVAWACGVPRAQNQASGAENIVPKLQSACCDAFTGECTNTSLGVCCGPPDYCHTGGCRAPQACDIPSEQTCPVPLPYPGAPCCADLDARCCQDLGGTPQGVGTSCSAPEPEACCMGDGTCQNLVPSNCTSQGGTPEGAGSACQGVQACCTGATCRDVDAACCAGQAAGAGTNCTEDGDYDDVPLACDNCPEAFNPANDAPFDCNGDGDTLDPGEAVGEQCDIDSDGVGDVCDNCPQQPNPRHAQDTDCDGDGIINPIPDFGELAGMQCDQDADTRGDECDNCPSDYNLAQTDSDARCSLTNFSCGPGPNSGDYQECEFAFIGEVCLTDTVYPNGYFAFGDACDNCVDLLDPNQADCDEDGLGDPCDDEPDCDGDGIPDACDDQPDCDGDGIPDDCDDDDDGDGILDVDDLCDFTPAGGNVVTDPASPFYGTIPGDLDGDCDVDDFDACILNQNFTGAGTCTDGQNVGEGCPAGPLPVPPPTCP